MPKPKPIEYNKAGVPMFLCPSREMHLRIEDNSGYKCHLGSVGDVCNLDGELCDVHVNQRAYELAHPELKSK